jgi:hypothetical protein
MIICASSLPSLLTAMLATFLEAAALNEALPWLVMAALLGFGAVVFWRKRRAIASPHDVKAPLPAWEQPFIPKQVLPQENEQVAAELVQELDKQVLQLKMQLEVKNKVLDHLVQHLLPKALAVESLKVHAQELIDLVKSVQLTAHFSNHTLADLPSDFEQKLLLAHPDLTNEDLRLCSYLHLHFSSLKIAQIKAISVAGVNKSRSRLRKKLQLDAEADLGLYLNGLQD